MTVEINPKLYVKDWNHMSELFQMVGWDKRSPKDIKQSFKKSAVVCIIKMNNEIIGFGRTVDDGKYYALLVDVVVHPNHHKKGVGTIIVNTLTEHLKGYNFITLTAAPNKEGFYQKLGWKKQKSAYIIPKDQKQHNDHCE